MLITPGAACAPTGAPHGPGADGAGVVLATAGVIGVMAVAVTGLSPEMREERAVGRAGVTVVLGDVARAVGRGGVMVPL